MERDLNFGICRSEKQDGGIIPPSRYSGNRSSFVLSSLGQRFSLCKDGI